MHENYQSVVHQMEQFGVIWRAGTVDLPLKIGHEKRKTVGKGGKWWYWLQTFTRGGRDYIVGAFGSYKTGHREKVEVDWAPLDQAERERLRAERAAAERCAAEAREREAALAAMSAGELWRTAQREGRSAYLERKMVEPEACRWLPDGSIVIPLLRYDRPKESALMGTQRIWPNGKKRFTSGFAKTGAALRLGPVLGADLLLVCEGYATGLTLRMAVQRGLPVFVALDAYNLQPVCELLRGLYPDARLLICADDDYRTEGNPGRDRALQVCKALDRCDMTWPSFANLTRGEKDTDFNDLHVLAGLRRVHTQMRATLDAIRRFRRAAA
jgi:putative DNA primase/helicase